MRRIAGVAIIAVLALVAVAAPAPGPEPEPLSGVVIERPGIGSPADASIWYCPWAQATSTRDSVLSLVTMSPAEADVSFPVLVSGEPADTVSLSMAGPAGASITMSDVAQRGHSPGFVEFQGGPSGVSVTVSGDDMLAADGCVARGDDEWFFVGGSTLTGDALTLRLFNPFPVAATVSVSAFSELGLEAIGDLGTIGVNPRSWRDIGFEEMLRQRQSLVVSVRARTGLVIPAMSFTRDGDSDWWAGSPLSTDWEIPVVRVSQDDQAAVVVANPGVAEITVDVELYGTHGGERRIHTVVVQPGTPAVLDLAEVEHPIVAARASSPSPFVAGVVSVGPSGTAVTAGLPEPGRSWLLPGARVETGRVASLWLLNTGEEAMVVTVSRLTADEVINSTEILQPGIVTRVPVVGRDTLGYLLRSQDAFSAAWTVSEDGAMAYSRGLLVPDD